MTFYTNYKNKSLINYHKAKAISSARRTIILYKFGANEKILDNYFIKNHHMTLRHACLHILFNLKLSTNFDGRIVLKTSTDNYDKIARFITFGDGIIPGSKILLTALNK